MVGNGIEHCTLSQELGTDVAIVEELSEPQLVLSQHGHLFTFVMDNPDFANRGGGDMHQPCSVLDAEIHTALCTANVHVFNVCALGEVFHVGGTIEDRVDRAVHLDFLCHVAIRHKEAGAEQFFE